MALNVEKVVTQLGKIYSYEHRMAYKEGNITNFHNSQAEIRLKLSSSKTMQLIPNTSHTLLYFGWTVDTGL